MTADIFEITQPTHYAWMHNFLYYFNRYEWSCMNRFSVDLQHTVTALIVSLVTNSMTCLWLVIVHVYVYYVQKGL